MWAFDFSHEINVNEKQILGQIHSFLLENVNVALRLDVVNKKCYWCFILADTVMDLPEEFDVLGQRSLCPDRYTPRYWVKRLLVKDDQAVQISGASINEINDFPLEGLVNLGHDFKLSISMIRDKSVPYCKKDALFSVEIASDNEIVANRIAKWLNGRVAEDQKTTFVYSTELKFILRPPISTEAYYPKGSFSDSGSINNIVINNPDMLSRHCLICGQTGSGKTNTAKVLLEQLFSGEKYQGQILLMDNKGEYRSWAKAQNIKYYEVGQHPEVLRLLGVNPFIPGRQVKLINHIETLSMILSVSGFSGAGVILPEYMKLLLFEFYKHLWRVDDIKFLDLLQWHGEAFIRSGYPFAGSNGETIPFLINKFWEEKGESIFGRIVGHASGKSLLDIRGILSARISSLIYSPMNYFSYSDQSSPPDVLLEDSYVLSFKGISDSQLVLLASLLIFLFCETARVLDGNSNLRNLLLVEEAHLVMRKTIESGEMITANSLLAENINRMLAELRSQGIGLVLIDQSPSQLIPGVIANTGTKIIHRLSSPDDISMIGDSLGLRDTSELRYLDQGQCFYKYDAEKPHKAIIDLWDSN